MTTREIPSEQWQTFFDDLSKRYFHWQTTVEVQAGELGNQPEAEEVPLQGISFEPVGSEKGDIEVALGDSPDSFQVHRIEKPTHVRVADTRPGVETDVEIESAEGSKTLIHLRPYPELTKGERRS